MHFNFYSKNMLQKSYSKLLKSRGGGEEEEEGNIMQNANKEAARHQRIIYRLYTYHEEKGEEIIKK